MLSRRSFRRAGISAALLTAACVVAHVAPGQEADVDAVVTEAVQDMEEATPEQVFVIARELDRLGPSGLDAARNELESAGPRARLGLARYLLGQGERGLALKTLEETVRGEDTAAAALAAEMIERYARGRKEVEGLKAVLEEVRDPSVKIAVAKALRAKARDTSAERVLKDYLKSEEFEVRAKAALALGDLGNIEAAKAVLSELSDEPTERGKRAKSLLYQEKLFQSLRKSQGLDQDDQVLLLRKKVEDLQAQLKKAEKGGGGADGPKGKGHDLVAELVRNIKRYYVEDSEKLEDQTLFDSAAKGMVSSLDPFSSYMTEKETADFKQQMRGNYAGIGAVVSMDPKDKLLTIIRPIYSGPAYKAGLRSLDKVTQVEGQSTFGKTVEELVTVLKGKPHSEVNIRVYRKGWKKERDFTLVRETISLKSVKFEMLPGKIGYVELSQFGDNAVEEVKTALDTLEADGMVALVVDLRANPGGLLSAAVDISDMFLKDNKLIVYSEGRNPQIAPRREYRTRDAATHPDYPLVILVNKASASASEIVSGALQDHGRAILVGQNTFGKGSVQQLLKVRTTKGQSTLRLTIAKYYLPSGRSIHRDQETGKGGVDPDIVIEPPVATAWEIEMTDDILESGAIPGYVEKLWKEHRAAMRELASADFSEHDRYPGFEDMYQGLKTPLDRELVRRLVRGQLRRLAQDDNGAEFPTDLQEDLQLQRAVYEVLKKVGTDPAAFEHYKTFSEKFAEATPGPDPEGEVR